MLINFFNMLQKLRHIKKHQIDPNLTEKRKKNIQLESIKIHN